MYCQYEPIEEMMMIEKKDERVYEKDGDLYCCTRLQDITFIHSSLGSGYSKLMLTLGYPGHETDSSQDVPLPDLWYDHEWFWPHVTYRLAERLLNDRYENMVVIRKSKGGHFALTAGTHNIQGGHFALTAGTLNIQGGGHFALTAGTHNIQGGTLRSNCRYTQYTGGTLRSNCRYTQYTGGDTSL